MKKFRLVLTALAAALIASALLRPAPARAGSSQETLAGTVSAVYDGDTLRVRLAGRPDERVRLIGVDAPELDDARERVRLMAFLAKRFTFTRLFRATVELLPGPEKRDAYGRLLAFVRTSDGEMFNVILVQEGYAFAYLKFPFDEAWRKKLKEAEASARQSGKGLWKREPFPVIGAPEAGRCVGKIVTVRFRCARTFKRGSVRILEAEGAEFEAVIPLDVLKMFPGSLDFGGRRVETTGLVELYRGHPQVMIGVPVQLKRIDKIVPAVRLLYHEYTQRSI